MKLNQPRNACEPVAPGTGHEPAEADIQKAAFYLWQGKGCPEGCDLDTWLEAKELLRHRATHVTAAGHEPAVRAQQSTKRAPAKVPAALHFPPAHQTLPAHSAVTFGESAHLDFRHSTAPFPPKTHP